MTAWLIVLCALVSMYPWAEWLLVGIQRRNLFIVTTTLGLSSGILSLILLWQGLLGLPIRAEAAFQWCIIISIYGWIVLLRSRRDIPAFVDPIHAVSLPPLRLVAGTLLGVTMLLVLFNAVWWPFSIDDAVTIYAYWGKHIAQTGSLPIGKLYELYPMHIPLNYAFVFQLSGWMNEYLANLFPTVLSIGALLASYLLGSSLFSRGVGLIAATLTWLTPAYVHWASAGYTDLPTGFYYGMTALFAYRWRMYPTWRLALLTGIMAGLAMWTKNSGLLVVASLGLWWIYTWLDHRIVRRVGELGITHRSWIAIPLGIILVAGPWYLRNWLNAGMIVPPTGWTSQAQPNLANLFPYLTHVGYGISGVIFTVGFGYTLQLLVRSWLRKRELPSALTLLIVFVAPFFVVWYFFFSYDVRFLLAVFPFSAVFGAFCIQAAWSSISQGWQPTRRFYTQSGIALVLLALPTLWQSVKFKRVLLTNPLMNDAEKHRVVLGQRYDVALQLSRLPTGSRVLTQELYLPLHANHVQVMVGGVPPDLASAQQVYDYWVLDPNTPAPSWLTERPIIQQIGGWRVYALH